MEIQKAIQAYLIHCKIEKNLSPKTLQAYQTDLKQFYNFIQKESICNLSEVSRTELRGYFNSLSNLKPRSIKRKMTCLKSMFTYMEFDDVIKINPFRKMQLKYKMPKYLPMVMNKKEIRKILKVAYSNRDKINNKSSYSYAEATRDICILEMLFATGIRVSELCFLHYKNIDLKSGKITILGKGNKERIVQIVEQETKSVLLEYHSLFKAKIFAEKYFFINRFGNGISSQSIRHIVSKYAKIANINKKITPHTFRHTFATLLLEADVDIKYIQHFLGHSSIMTTQIYTHVNKQKQERILKTKHPRMSFKMFEE